MKEFLTGCRRGDGDNEDDYDNDNEDYAQPAVCITTKGSIFTAAVFMIENHMHRVWVVAPSDYSGMDGYGVGCVSLTDILTTIALFTSPTSSPKLGGNHNHHHNHQHNHNQHDHNQNQNEDNNHQHHHHLLQLQNNNNNNNENNTNQEEQVSS